MAFAHRRPSPSSKKWDLVEQWIDGVEYPTKLRSNGQGGDIVSQRGLDSYATWLMQNGFLCSKFGNVSSVTLYFTSNFGGETTKIYYIGFKGEFTSYKRAVVEAVYEARPVPKDHKASTTV